MTIEPNRNARWSRFTERFPLFRWEGSRPQCLSADEVDPVSDLGAEPAPHRPVWR